MHWRVLYNLPIGEIGFQLTDVTIAILASIETCAVFKRVATFILPYYVYSQLLLHSVWQLSYLVSSHFV